MGDYLMKLQAEKVLDHNKLYRLPWSAPDNAIAWIEVTTACNLRCTACYRENTNKKKTVEELSKYLDELSKFRKFDCVAISGGDPLLHPDLIEIVRMIRKRGLAPYMYTGGLTITEDLLKELRDEGLRQVLFHVDSKQKRPGWEGKSESELNDLRLKYATMIDRVGRVRCHFTMTVFKDTLKDVPDVVEWAHKNIDKVHGICFICFRSMNLEDFNGYVGNNKRIENDTSYQKVPAGEGSAVTTRDIVELILNSDSQYRPSAYLNGTSRPNVLKWLGAWRVGNKKNIYGYVGPKVIEIAQTVHHLLRGRYPGITKKLKIEPWDFLSWAWLFDRHSRSALGKLIGDFGSYFKRTYLQSIAIMQPNDILPDGRVDMCDGCPDALLWNGTLIPSCRLEEFNKYGQFVQLVPK
jgi:MoaA/NifB/PqqE/SkfB family radical SAM enzyme